MKRVSIVILNWNGKKYLKQFLPHLLRHTGLPGAEIVIGDNASTDGSVTFLESEYPEIRLVKLDRNYGYTGGFNRVLRQLDATYFLLLNSDVEVTEGWLPPLLELMDKKQKVAVCAPKIREYHRRSFFEYAGAAGGYIDRYGFPFCRGRIFDHLEEDRGQYDDPARIFWASGACFLVRAELFRAAGGLDERFFAHMEEIDLCWRLKRMGYEICYEPRSLVYHVGGGALPQGNPMKTFYNYRNNMLLLYKNLSPKKRRRIIPVKLLLDMIAALRFLFMRSPANFLAVIRAHRAYSRLRREYKREEETGHRTDYREEEGPGHRTDYREEEGPGPRKGREEAADTGIYPGSIVMDYFLKGKKRFEQLSFTTIGWPGRLSAGKEQNGRENC